MRPISFHYCSLVAGALLVTTCGSAAAAEKETSSLVLRPAKVTSNQTAKPAPPPAKRPPAVKPIRVQSAAPVEAAAYRNHRMPADERQVVFHAQLSEELPPQSTSSSDTSDPCVALLERPITELGIGIALPDGQLPKEPAAECWARVNRSAGPFAAARFWPMFDYSWNATCLCHRPLYFEEINLERHGYGCPNCLQAGVSAAHFFATVPALPYCMAVECPCECVYTLGHYRPGSCPPWRHHWPPCSPLAAAAEGGVLTGMIFLIP